jgi:cation:H+ antiporter
MLAGGLIGLPVGAHFVVTGAQEIALAWGMSDAAIGLTVVALGTSLPELAATAMAALRRESAIAVGNVIGSNIFNLLAIMGVTALVAPIPVSPAVLRVDLWMMLAASLVVVPFVVMRVSIGRLAGFAFVGVYVAYVAMVIGARSVALASP